jgi:hypothetical protein
MINGTLKPTGNFAKTMGSFEFWMQKYNRIKIILVIIELFMS